MILDGKKTAEVIKNEIKGEVEKNNYQINLATILVGDDPASRLYIRNKKKACEYVGINIFVYELPEKTTQEELLNLLDKLNQDEKITGIFVQLPLPKHIDAKIIMQSIDEAKDVDGFHPLNLGKLLIGKPKFISCTPLAVVTLLDFYKIKTQGQNCVIIGRSIEVGKPLALLMINLNSTVTICHSYTRDLFEITKKADILISAIGKANFIKKEYIKSGATLIDIGMNKNPETNKTCGDIDFEDCYSKAKNITPVPGGIGPMTVTMLLKNCLLAHKLKLNTKVF